MLMARNNSFLNVKNNTLKNWAEFKFEIEKLAEKNHSIEQKIIVKQGLELLQQLDIDSGEFKQAVKFSYETGNRYWLWQRLMKEDSINGGILNINRDQLVQLHDHPGAIGMVRIMSGETEVWQYDIATKKKNEISQNLEKLLCVNHKILKAGDIAFLTPNKGNIHALRAVTQECRMLDFFIPPYKRSQRSWYEPISKNWFNEKNIVCKKISQDEFKQA